MFARFKAMAVAMLALGMSVVAVPAHADGYDPSNSTTIPTGAQIWPGGNFVSPDGRFNLIFQASDRNVVLYQGGRALWSARTNETGCTTPPGAPRCTPPQMQYIIFQADGNFVAYDQYGHGWGISKTSGNSNSHLALQNDGNLVIYNSGNRAIWSTKTCCH